MDGFILFLTRDESVGDRIEFNIKKDIPILFVKKLLSLKLPYHPDESNLTIYWNGELQGDDVMVFSLVRFLLEIGEKQLFVSYVN